MFPLACQHFSASSYFNPVLRPASGKQKKNKTNFSHRRCFHSMASFFSLFFFTLIVQRIHGSRAKRKLHSLLTHKFSKLFSIEWSNIKNNNSKFLIFLRAFLPLTRTFQTDVSMCRRSDSGSGSMKKKRKKKTNFYSHKLFECTTNVLLFMTTQYFYAYFFMRIPNP